MTKLHSDRVAVDLNEGEDGNPDWATINVDGDHARVIYFALCNERDKVVKDIARYNDLAKAHYTECREHGLKKTDWCEECVRVDELRKEGQKLEHHRDEDLHFLGSYLNQICAILFEIGQNNTDEFQNWLSV